jgi:hypothetical protein
MKLIGGRSTTAGLVHDAREQACKVKAYPFARRGLEYIVSDA